VRRVTRAAIIVAVLAVAGCGTDQSASEARSSVERFFAAIEAGDGPAACEQLSEDASSALETSEAKPCEEAVLSLRVSPSAVASASVWVTSAQVALRSGDAAFLDQVAGEWKIAAVGCRPQPGKPYECELDG
jgi:outer membrane murein-binding lipoprotein Lpp